MLLCIYKNHFKSGEKKMPKYKIRIENSSLERIGKAVIVAENKIDFKRSGIKGLINFIENNFYNISSIDIILNKFDSQFFAAATLVQNFSLVSDEIKVERRKEYFEINYNGFEFVFAGKNMKIDNALRLKDATTHEDFLSKEKIEALEKISELFPLIAFQKMKFEIKFKRTDKNWFALEHIQKKNNYFLEGNENINLFSSGDDLGKNFYKIRFKKLDKIDYQIEKGYLGSELFIETEKETIEFWDWKKHLKYTEKADSFFEFLTRKKVSINFDFKNKKFHFEDDIDENHKIETVKKIEKILKNVLQFGYASEFDDMLKMFENYLAKFKNKKVDERIEMIKNFKI
jgi:hypothetical protein